MLRNRDGKRIACTRAHFLHLSFQRGRIKRNPQKYKFIIVRAEPFFPPNSRGAFFCDFYLLTRTQSKGIFCHNKIVTVAVYPMIRKHTHNERLKQSFINFFFFLIIQQRKTFCRQNRKLSICLLSKQKVIHNTIPFFF